jgi:outer membrane immunogenic protein
MKRLTPGLLTLTLAAVALAPVARAADLPVPAPAPAPVYRPALYNWTGFYIGGHAGAGFLQDSFQSTTTTVLQNSGSTTDVNKTEFLGGAQAGYNYQFAPWVVGVEGSFSWSNIDGSAIAPTLLTPGTGVQERSRSSPNWLAAATGRVGYAADTLLFYAKGGIAWMAARYREDLLAANGGTISSFSVNNTRTGFVVGAGVEYGMTENLTARLEYDFYDFGSQNYTFNLTAPGPTSVVQPVSIKSNVQAVTVGLNYRFNWGPQPECPAC